MVLRLLPVLQVLILLLYEPKVFSEGSVLRRLSSETSDSPAPESSGTVPIARRLQQSTGVAVKDRMRGKHIKVVLKLDPAMVVNATVDNTLAYEGFAIDYLEKMSQGAGFTYEFVRASKEGRGGGWNDAWWDMAVWGDGLVNADLFWSASFWTAGRQSVADCTASWLDTGLHVMVYMNVKSTKLDAFIKSMWTLFAPFKPPLWGLIMCVVVLYSVMIFLVERHAHNDHPLVVQIQKGPAGTNRSRNWSVTGVLNEIYLTSIFLTVQGGRVPTTPFGKMLVLSFSVFIMAVLGAYTANLATILTLRAGAKSAFDNLDHIINSGHTLCLWQGAAYTGLMKLKYPEMSVYEVTTAEIFNGVALDAVRSGKCAGLCIPEMHSTYLLKEPTNCDISLAGGLEMPMNYVGGVSRESPNIDIKTISYWVGYLRENQEGGGTFHEKLFKQYFTQPKGICDTKQKVYEYSSDTGDWEQVDSTSMDAALDVEDVGGVMVLLFLVFCGIFVAKWQVDFVHRKFLKNVWSMVDKDHSGSLDEAEVAAVRLRAPIQKLHASLRPYTGLVYVSINIYVEIDHLDFLS
jgi:hypothetical protein